MLENDEKKAIGEFNKAMDDASRALGKLLPEEQTQPKEEEKPEEPFMFDLLYSPKYPGQRYKAECDPKEWHMHHGLRAMNQFLLTIDDYDFVREVCQIKENDYEHKGIGTLINLPGVPHYYQGGEDYQQFLSHVERLMGMYLYDRDTYYPYSLRYTRFGQKERHPYPFLLYALAVLPLGPMGQAVAGEHVYMARDIERECPALGWVWGQVDLARYHYREST